MWGGCAPSMLLLIQMSAGCRNTKSPVHRDVPDGQDFHVMHTIMAGCTPRCMPRFVITHGLSPHFRYRNRQASLETFVDPYMSCSAVLSTLIHCGQGSLKYRALSRERCPLAYMEYTCPWLTGSSHSCACVCLPHGWLEFVVCTFVWLQNWLGLAQLPQPQAALPKAATLECAGVCRAVQRGVQRGAQRVCRGYAEGCARTPKDAITCERMYA